LTFPGSINFLGMRLSKIPECFDLNELCKGYLPHLFNTSENQHYVVGLYTYTKFYSCDYMESGDREQFLEWYESKKDKIFDFQNEIHEYCVSDVDILRRGCMKFRNLLMEVTSTKKDEGVDPFDYVTIASVCQGIFRKLFLEETYETMVLDRETGRTSRWPTMFQRETGNTEVQLPEGQWVEESNVDESMYQIGKTIFGKSPIAMVPSEGYTVTDNFSRSSIQWLEWTMDDGKRNGEEEEACPNKTCIERR